VEVTTPTRLYVELPVLLQRQQLADSLARYLTTLGLQRVGQCVPTLQEYLQSRNGETRGPGGTAAPRRGPEGRTHHGTRGGR
jgi:hypothetical protein